MVFQLFCWFPEAGHVGSHEGDSPVATWIPSLVRSAVFTPHLGVPWNIQAWHKLWFVRGRLPGECQKVEHPLEQGCIAHTVVCSTPNILGCWATWIFTVAKVALLCRPSHGQVDPYHLPKVVMPSAVYVGVVHVNFECWWLSHVIAAVSCAQLDGSVSWSNITKKNDDFWILVGAPVSKTSTTPKKSNLGVIQACNWEVPEQAHAKAPVRDQGKVHLTWLVFFENSETVNMVPSGFMYVWYLRTCKTRTRSRSWNAVATMGKCLQLSCSLLSVTSVCQV